MKTQLTLCSMLVATALSSAADAANVRIIGGKETRLEQYPFITGIVAKGDAASNVSCGASVIAPQWVLTAAHCVTDTNPNAHEVIVNTDNLGNATAVNRVAVSQIILHPQYDDNQIVNDIALIKLTSPVNTTPVRLARNSDQAVFAEGQPVSVAGWGNLSTTGEEFPLQLHAVELEVSNFAACSSAYQNLPDTNICASVPGGSKDSCQGDSGGPLVARTENGPVQVGIVSFGEECASATNPGVYTKVSSFENFLSTALGEVTATPPVVAAPTPPVVQDPDSNANEVTNGAVNNPVDNVFDPEIDDQLNDPAEVVQAQLGHVNNGDGIEFAWVSDFGLVEAGESAYAYAELYNTSELPVVFEAAEVKSGSGIEIQNDECAGLELSSGEFCYIDLAWMVNNSGELDGVLSIVGFDGSSSQRYALPLEGASLDQVDFGPTVEMPDTDFFTSDETQWSMNGEALAGESALSADMGSAESLTLDAELDWESDALFEFGYQLEGVNCIVYVDDEAQYELAASSEWQQVSIEVPAGANVRWEFNAWTRSDKARKVKLDGFKRLAADSPVGGAGSAGAGLLMLSGLMLIRRTREQGLLKRSVLK